MVEGNMGKFESQIGGFQSGGEFFVSENIAATLKGLEARGG
jgi:hypothetical protein